MNTNAKHSPGPWQAYNADNGRIFKHWRIKGCAVRNDPPFAIIDSGGKILPEYEAANAQLMASAPTMLEALRYASELMQTARRYFPKRITSTDRFHLENACATINKAISQAEGGAQ